MTLGHLVLGVHHVTWLPFTSVESCTQHTHLHPALHLRCRAAAEVATQCGRDEGATGGAGPLPHQDRASCYPCGQN